MSDLRTRLIAGTALACAMAAAGPALAQQSSGSGPSAPGTSATSNQLTEVLVTAERSTSSAQKTAITMQVFDQRTLETAGVNNVQALTTIAPGLSLNQNVGQPFLALRGVTSTSVNEIGDPAVIVATDGFYLNRYYQLQDGFYDVARVEVLKGPQGTLYGRNAVGGVVNIIDNEPQGRPAGFAAIDVGSYNTINVEGMANVPLSDTLWLRASFLSQNHKGYTYNPIYGTPGMSQRSNDQDSQSGRIQLAWRPSDHFKALLTFQYSHDGGVGPAVEALPWQYAGTGCPPAGAASGTTGPCVVQGVQPYGDGHSFLSYAPSSEDITGKQLRWNFTYDALPGGMTLTYLGGYDQTTYHKVSDTTAGGTTPVVPTLYYQNEYPVTQNHELRLASPTGGRFTWQAGLFYFVENTSLESPAALQSGPPVIRFYEPDTRTTSKAVYGQASYKPVDTLKLTAGIRYTSDEKVMRNGTFSVYPEAIGLSLPYPAYLNPLAVESYTGSSKSSKVTYHAGIDWTPTSTNLVYFKYDTGYKAGGFNPVAGAASTPFAPETIRGFEVGTKNWFFDRHLQLNLATFDYDYDNLQVTQFLQTGLSSSGATTNAKAATNRGVELQAVAIVEPVGRFDVEVDYLDAKFKDFLEATIAPLSQAAYPNCTAAPAQNCQLAGNTLPFSPKVIVALGFEHNWRDVLSGTLTFNVRSHIQSKEYFDAFNFPDTTQGAYTRTDLSLTYRPNAGDWTLQVYARNLEDATVLTDAQLTSTAGIDAYIYNFAPPRTYGVKFMKDF